MAWRTGVADAYTRTQSAWRVGHDIVPFRPWVDNAAILLFQHLPQQRLVAAVAVLALAAAIVWAALGPWSARLPWELRAWLLAYPAYLLAVVDLGTSAIRFVIPLFPIALVLIGGGRRTIPRWWPMLAAVLLALALWAQYEWATHLLVLTPPSDFPP